MARANFVSPSTNIADYLVENRPDWFKIDFDVECPRCGYNLRMLESPRCPECGLEIDWHLLLDKRFDRNLFLFEYQMGQRPLTSWFQTAAAALFPWRFWNKVSLFDRVQLRPLIAFLAISPLAFLVSYHGVSWVLYEILNRLLLRFSLAWPDFLLNWVVMLENVSFPSMIGPGLPILSGLTWYCSILLGIWCVLWTLRVTRARCRIRTAQLFRVIAYGSFPIAVFSPWFTLVTSYLLLKVAIVWDLVLWIMVNPLGGGNPLSVLVLTCLFHGLLLWPALGGYLRLPRAFLIGVAGSFVGQLGHTVACVLWWVWSS